MDRLQRNNVKVLVVTRLFSGLIRSVVEEKWQPTGIPAMYRFIEGLSRHHIPAVVVFLCKTAMESKDINEPKIFTFDDEQVSDVAFHVVPFKPLPICSTKLNAMWNGWRQWRYCVRVLKEKNPNVIYCDRSDVIFGATARVWFHKKVILRLLGFYPDMKKFFTTIRYKFFSPLTYFAYCAPFSGIICTQDDSGGSYYLSKLPNKKVPKKLLVNGVDHKISTRDDLDSLRRQHRIVNDRPIFLYVGKLEESKGCLEFVEVMATLYVSGYRFYAFIIGAGPLAEEIQARIQKRNLTEVMRFVGAVDNKKTHHYYNLADVYVHLYVWASLTNTVLEAMRAGNALVLISPSKKEHIGEYTEKFIPEDCKIVFDRNNIAESLTQALKDLLCRPQKIIVLKKNMKMFCEQSLYSWDDRIEKELQSMEYAKFE